jgi:hypothetical protein
MQVPFNFFRTQSLLSLAYNIFNMVRVVIFGLFLVMAMTIFHEAHAQTCTYCISGGTCPCTHPQCCTVNGAKKCCRIILSRSDIPLNKDMEKIIGKVHGNDDSVPRSSDP